jgi:hypothetical protein
MEYPPPPGLPAIGGALAVRGLAVHGHDRACASTNNSCLPGR